MQRPFAAVGDDDVEGESLIDTVKRVSNCSNDVIDTDLMFQLE